MFLFIKIVFAIIIIAIVSYVNIGMIWAFLSGLSADTIMIITAIASVLIAFLSGVVAVIALLANLREGKETRMHSRLSVRPQLTTVHNVTLKGSIRKEQLEILNCGNGSATIKSFVLEMDGKEITQNDFQEYHEFFKKKTVDFNSKAFGFIGLGTIIKAGDRQNLWEITYDSKKQNLDFLDNINFKVKYQSSYLDEVFIYNSKQAPKFT